MKRMIDTLLRQHGTAMVLRRGDGDFTVRGFFQPVRSRSLQSVVSHATALGQLDRGQFIYIGPADVEAAQGDELTVGGQCYILRRTELYRCGDEPVYTWGLCMEKGGEAQWQIP